MSQIITENLVPHLSEVCGPWVTPFPYGPNIIQAMTKAAAAGSTQLVGPVPALDAAHAEAVSPLASATTVSPCAYAWADAMLCHLGVSRSKTARNGAPFFQTWTCAISAPTAGPVVMSTRTEQ